MGLFNNLFQPQQPTTPTITSILPDVAKQEILNGRLPILKTDKVFLKSGETCHFIDKALYEKKSVHKHYVRHNSGVSMPGIFKGNRVHFGGGETTVEDDVSYSQIRGILYITNKRMIFVGETEGFDEPISSIVAVTPYSNCIEIQFTKKQYRIFIPDGGLVHQVLQQIA